MENESILTVHFDSEKHSIDSKVYMSLIESIDNILAETLFRLKLEDYIEYSIMIYPHDYGGLITKSGIITSIKKTTFSIILIGGLIGFAESDMVSGFIKGITGKEINYYDVGNNLGDFLRDFVQGIFEIDTEGLNKIIPEEINLDKVVKAKSDFYHSCIHSSSVKRIGFNDVEDFPIAGDQFIYHVFEGRTRPIVPNIKIEDFIIVSPVDIDVDAKWRVRESKKSETIGVSMLDKEFKKNFLKGMYPLKKSSNDDHIYAELEEIYQEVNGEIKLKDRNIKNVYKFNSEVIKTIPNDLRIKINKKDEDPDNLELF